MKRRRGRSVGWRKQGARRLHVLVRLNEAERAFLRELSDQGSVAIRHCIGLVAAMRLMVGDERLLLDLDSGLTNPRSRKAKRRTKTLRNKRRRRRGRG